MLIKIFDPNQFVLVATSGTPFSPETTELFAPQTLNRCLHLTYVCRSVIINGVPASSGNKLRGHHRAGNIIVRRADWAQATFHVNRELGGYATGTLIYSGTPSTAETCSTDDRTANSFKATNTRRTRTRGSVIRQLSHKETRPTRAQPASAAVGIY